MHVRELPTAPNFPRMRFGVNGVTPWAPLLRIESGAISMETTGEGKWTVVEGKDGFKMWAYETSLSTHT